NTPAPAVLPAGWTGWLKFSAPGVPSGTTCCVLLTFQCGLDNAQIYVCAKVCRWATLDGVPEPGRSELGFGIRAIVPNPTAGRANVRFEMPLTGAVRVEVFDAMGKRVRTLADEQFAPGLHSVAWDGLDARGNRSRPGAYFIRMTSGGRSSTHLVV